MQLEKGTALHNFAFKIANLVLEKAQPAPAESPQAPPTPSEFPAKWSTTPAAKAKPTPVPPSQPLSTYDQQVIVVKKVVPISPLPSPAPQKTEKKIETKLKEEPEEYDMPPIETLETAKPVNVPENIKELGQEIVEDKELVKKREELPGRIESEIRAKEGENFLRSLRDRINDMEKAQGELEEKDKSRIQPFINELKALKEKSFSQSLPLKLNATTVRYNKELAKIKEESKAKAAPAEPKPGEYSVEESKQKTVSEPFEVKVEQPREFFVEESKPKTVSKPYDVEPEREVVPEQVVVPEGMRRELKEQIFKARREILDNFSEEIRNDAFGYKKEILKLYGTLIEAGRSEKTHPWEELPPTYEKSKKALDEFNAKFAELKMTYEARQASITKPASEKGIEAPAQTQVKEPAPVPRNIKEVGQEIVEGEELPEQPITREVSEEVRKDVDDTKRKIEEFEKSLGRPLNSRQSESINGYLKTLEEVRSGREDPNKLGGVQFGFSILKNMIATEIEAEAQEKIFSENVANTKKEVEEYMNSFDENLLTEHEQATLGGFAYTLAEIRKGEDYKLGAVQSSLQELKAKITPEGRAEEHRKLKEQATKARGEILETFGKEIKKDRLGYKQEILDLYGTLVDASLSEVTYPGERLPTYEQSKKALDEFNAKFSDVKEKYKANQPAITKLPSGETIETKELESKLSRLSDALDVAERLTKKYEGVEGDQHQEVLAQSKKIRDEVNDLIGLAPKKQNLAKLDEVLQKTQQFWEFVEKDLKAEAKAAPKPEGETVAQGAVLGEAPPAEIPGAKPIPTYKPEDKLRTECLFD